jgi:hypothetical protein
MATYTTASDIVNAALQELGMGTVNLAAGSLDATGWQLLGLLNSLGDELCRAHDWQNLERVQTFTGDGSTTNFALPADFGRQVNQTQWSASDNRPMQGPVSPQLWAWDQYGIVAPGVFYQYRILNDSYAVYPTPASGTTFDLYYISKNWVRMYDSSPVTYDYKISLPGDIPQFDRRLLIAGLKLKYWAAKGLDTTVLAEEFNYLLSSEKSNTQGAPVINLSPPPGPLLVGWQNVPDTGFGI